MSKRLGDNYITPASIGWHTRSVESHTYLTIEDGKRISMPRYYKDKIYSEEQRKRIAFLGQQKADELYAEQLRKKGSHYEVSKSNLKVHQYKFQQLAFSHTEGRDKV